jgi:hypothetical protein
MHFLYYNFASVACEKPKSAGVFQRVFKFPLLYSNSVPITNKGMSVEPMGYGSENSSGVSSINGLVLICIVCLHRL